MLVHGLGQNRYAWHRRALDGEPPRRRAAGTSSTSTCAGHGRSGVGDEALVDRPLRRRPRARDGRGARAHRGGSGAVGHSLGGLLLALAAREPERVAAVASFAAPYEFGAGNRALRALRWALDHAGPVSERARARRLPFELVWSLFRRGRRVWDAPRIPLPLRAWRPGAFEPAALDEYLSLAFDRGYVGELLDLSRCDAFDRAHGGAAMRERFESLSLPILVVAGEHDLLAPPASVLPAYTRSRSPARRYAALPFGHGDLLLGRDAPRLTWPTLDAWLASLPAP
ncbi:MAG: hypothetical protein R3A52_05710 [Polyangiales bacterium]